MDISVLRAMWCQVHTMADLQAYTVVAVIIVAAVAAVTVIADDMTMVTIVMATITIVIGLSESVFCIGSE